MAEQLPEGVTIAEIIDVLEAAGNVLCGDGHSFAGDLVDDLVKRLKEPSHG